MTYIPREIETYTHNGIPWIVAYYMAGFGVWIATAGRCISRSEPWRCELSPNYAFMFIEAGKDYSNAKHEMLKFVDDLLFAAAMGDKYAR